MSSCKELKKGDLFHCPDCGLEVQVVAECRDVSSGTVDCGCREPQPNGCVLSCCGRELARKG